MTSPSVMSNSCLGRSHMAVIGENTDERVKLGKIFWFLHGNDNFELLFPCTECDLCAIGIMLGLQLVIETEIPPLIQMGLLRSVK